PGQSAAPPKARRTPVSAITSSFVCGSYAVPPLLKERYGDASCLQIDLAVVLDALAVFQDLLHDSLVVGSFFKLHVHFQGHEVHDRILDAGRLLRGGLHLVGTVGAVDFYLIALL